MPSAVCFCELQRWLQKELHRLPSFLPSTFSSFFLSVLVVLALPPTQNQNQNQSPPLPHPPKANSPEIPFN
ncbi:hypothetical protein Gotur_005254 [Gossypium turneri]